MKVLLYGIIAEKAGAASIEVEAGDTTALRAALNEKIDGLNSISYSLAIDRVLTHNKKQLNGNEEVAALPPFAGG